MALLHHVIWEWVMTKMFGPMAKEDIRTFLASYDWYVSRKCHCVGLLTPLVWYKIHFCTIQLLLFNICLATFNITPLNCSNTTKLLIDSMIPHHNSPPLSQFVFQNTFGGRCGGIQHLLQSHIFVHAIHPQLLNVPWRGVGEKGL